MNRISNQDIERHCFEMFLKVYPLPPGAITYDDSPDVIVEGERRIGIEITNFFLEEGSLSESERPKENYATKSSLRLSGSIRQGEEGKSKLYLGLIKRTRSEIRRSPLGSWWNSQNIFSAGSSL